MYQSDLEEVGLPAIVACHFGVKALWGDSFVSGGWSDGMKSHSSLNCSCSMEMGWLPWLAFSTADRGDG
jgi:hypothetical protein